MRTRILVGKYEMEFVGRAGYWNECLRPIFGGPEAHDAPSVAADLPSDTELYVDESAPLETQTLPDTEFEDPETMADPSPAKPKRKAAKKAAKKVAKKASTKVAKKARKSAAKKAPPGAPATDVRLLYEDLAKAGGRRAEKDAVLATVWLLGGTQQDVTFDDVARHIHSVDFFREVRVKPHLLKHCSRSRMLEPGEERETVRMTKKGIRYIAGLMG